MNWAGFFKTIGATALGGAATGATAALSGDKVDMKIAGSAAIAGALIAVLHLYATPPGQLPKIDPAANPAPPASTKQEKK